jgi:hypothetical protein
MTSNRWAIRLALPSAALLTVLLMTASLSSADCAKDSKGEVYCGAGSCVRDSAGVVWCSRFYEGDAQIARDGTVLCGKGQCEKDTRGELFCSTEKGGAVLKDSQGRVRCYGRCEPASVEMCESTPADTSE